MIDVFSVSVCTLDFDFLDFPAVKSTKIFSAHYIHPHRNFTPEKSSLFIYLEIRPSLNDFARTSTITNYWYT